MRSLFVTLAFLSMLSAVEAFAKAPAKSGSGLHTQNRILIPADDSQELNFVVHKNIKNRGKVNAPLLWIEYVTDENGKSRTMRIKSQSNLSTGSEEAAAKNDE